MKLGYLIERPKERELSFNPVEDVTHLVKSFLVGNRIHREDDVRFISHQISRIFDFYKISATNEIDYIDACRLQHFIRVLNYGILFKFVVMIKLPNQTIHRIYYE